MAEPDFERGWNVISEKLIGPLLIFFDTPDFKGQKPYKDSEYMATYTECYNICSLGQRQRENQEALYKKHTEVFTQYLIDKVLPILKNKKGAVLIDEASRRWENHKLMNKWMKMFFAYLDQHFVKFSKVDSLETVGLKLYKQHIYQEIKQNLAGVVVDLMNDEREGLIIDRSLVQSTTNLFQLLAEVSTNTYNEDYEAALVRSAADYYKQRAEVWLIQDSTPSYLLKVEQTLDEEKNRALTYFGTATESRVIAAVETELLANKVQELLEKEGSGMKVLLINDKIEDLFRMYSLFFRVKDIGLQPMAEIFKQHIIDLGNEKIEARAVRIEALNEKDREKECGSDTQFVKDIIALHERYQQMITVQFGANALFQKALKDAFTEIVGSDSEYHNNATLLSSFCDQLLKVGGEKLQDSEIEIYLEKVVQMFTYLVDKDVFAEIFRNHLAKRLLNQKSHSNDMERSMISKLKVRCGGQYTCRLEGMMNDLSIGVDHQIEFDSYLKNGEKVGKMDFGVQVLTTGNWPTYKVIDFQLPPTMARCVQVFNEYYSTKTTKRRIQWVHSLGTGLVKGTYANKKFFDFQVTTVQAAVLLAFNSNTTVNFETLAANMRLEDEVLKRVMHSLCCGKFKIIKKDGPPNAIKTSDVFTSNNAFTCPMRKITVPMASLEETQNSNKRVEEDRSIAIEAAIVRIMKARKTLSHQQLVSEVLTQLAFFRPAPKVIKRRIEALIDREYLERNADNSSIYNYLA